MRERKKGRKENGDEKKDKINNIFKGKNKGRERSEGKGGKEREEREKEREEEGRKKKNKRKMSPRCHWIEAARILSVPLCPGLTVL